MDSHPPSDDRLVQVRDGHTIIGQEDRTELCECLRRTRQNPHGLIARDYLDALASGFHVAAVEYGA